MHRVQLFGLKSHREILAGDDLIEWISHMLAEAEITPADGDILVLAQKVVSKSEGRFARLDSVIPSPKARELARLTDKDPGLVELILSESTAVVRATPKVLIVRHRTGVVLANAGIDRSNVPQVGESETVLLWPKSPDTSAKKLHLSATKAFGAHVAVVINDSLGRAWRRGTIGTAIGSAGLTCLADLRGQEDRHGFALQSTEVGMADEVAAAASMVMGQASEGVAVVLVRGVNAEGRGQATDLVRGLREDLFR